MPDEITGAIITGAAALSGVIIGGLLTYWLQKRSWEREDSRRFDETRRIAYINLIRILYDLSFRDEEGFESRGLTEEQKKELHASLAASMTEIEILGPEKVYVGAREFVQAVTDPAEKKNFSSFPDSRREFIQSIRDELGIR